MLKRLLIPLDGSPMSEAVLPASSYLAAKAGAGVVLLHVMERKAPSSVHGQRHLTDSSEAVEYLRRVAAKAFPAGLDVQWHVHLDRIRNVGQSLANHACEFSPDLIVMCSHGGVRLRDRLLGNIPQQVLVRRIAPVLLLRADKAGKVQFPFTRILAPLDGQAAHEQALAGATDLAILCTCPLTLLTVVPTVGSLPPHQAITGSLLPGATREALDLGEDRAVEYIEGHVRRLRSAGLDASGRVTRGDPSGVIIETAEEMHADLIAIGSHGKAGSKAFWAGSILPRLIRRTKVSLLLAPVPKNKC